MSFCHHRYSNIKRWMQDGKLNVIQRCRKCDSWIKRVVNFADNEITKQRFKRRDLDHDDVIVDGERLEKQSLNTEIPNDQEQNGGAEQ